MIQLIDSPTNKNHQRNIIQLQHFDVHPLYCEISLPKEAAVMLRGAVGWSSREEFVHQMRRTYPRVTVLQGYEAWQTLKAALRSSSMGGVSPSDESMNTDEHDEVDSDGYDPFRDLPNDWDDEDDDLTLLASQSPGYIIAEDLDKLSKKLREYAQIIRNEKLFDDHRNNFASQFRAEAGEMVRFMDDRLEIERM